MCHPLVIINSRTVIHFYAAASIKLAHLQTWRTFALATNNKRVTTATHTMHATSFFSTVASTRCATRSGPGGPRSSQQRSHFPTFLLRFLTHQRGPSESATHLAQSHHRSRSLAVLCPHRRPERCNGSFISVCLSLSVVMSCLVVSLGLPHWCVANHDYALLMVGDGSHSHYRFH